ncbi:beta-microseminoprotein [Nannospalax galili]|uniref:beta-microseminoprotein n=1 Tax=Nannospalax galili TaxID=1026970 RepID=UPI000819CA8A|nr:beta-microseminoprotein [Nannospalax galili]
MLAETSWRNLPVRSPLITMKVLLGCLVVLASLVTSCNAQCYVQLLERLPDQTSDDCKDADGDKHPIDSSWEKNCETCFCTKDSIQCCNNVPIPMDYDSSKCEKIFHPDNCTYSVVERKDPGKACVVNSWIM